MTWFGAYAHCKALNSELFTVGVHEDAIASPMDGRYMWTGWAISKQPNPRPRWVWSSGSELRWTDREIRVPDLDCLGCGYLHNETLYLTSFCHKKHSFICRDEMSSGMYVCSLRAFYIFFLLLIKVFIKILKTYV